MTTRRVLHWATARAIPALVLLARCSMGPVSAGGTETGNPELSACAQELFQAMQPGSAWLPQTYVPGGTERLNPLSIYSAGVDTNPSLAKSAAVLEDTATPLSRTDSVYVNDTVVVRRTMFIPKTTYVLDTLVITRVVSDTIDSRGESDTTLTITKRLVVDSVFIRDTITTVDTIIYFDTLYLIDTLVIKDSAAQDAPDRQAGVVPAGNSLTPDAYYGSPEYVGPVYSDTAGLDYEFRSPENRSVMVAAPVANYSVLSSPGALMSAARHYTTSSGSRVWEEYLDLDGDNLLLAAAAPLIPRARFAHRLNGAFGAESVIVDFDAGEDGDLTTPSGNRINGLLAARATTQGSDFLTFVKPANDTASLTLEIQRLGGPVNSRLVRYTIHQPEPGTESRIRLFAIRPRWSYRLGNIDGVQAELELVSPIASGENPSRATVRFTCDLRSGSTGIFSGEIDAGAGVLTGTYDKEGKQYRVTAHRDGTVIEE